MEVNKAIYERALKREREARKSAEKILEQKASELYDLNQELNAKNRLLEHNFATKERELQDLFKNLVEGYVISDLEGYILNMNESARDIFELKPEGSFNLNSLVTGKERQHVDDGIALLMENESLSDYELHIVTPSDKSKTIKINASVIRDADNNMVALQALIRDVTEVRELETAQQTLLSKLKLQNQELEEFAHVISHDLKSPLRNLYTLNTWIKDSVEHTEGDKVSDYFKLIFSTLERMDTMISEILQFSKSDKDEMHFTEVDLDALLKVLSQQYLTKEKVLLTIDEGFPKVHGVKVKLYQVFQNLIDNAIKFNDKTEKIVKISLEKIDDLEVTVAVLDNGRGMSTRQQAKAFKLFETSEKDSSSSGVGLAIVKKILDAHESRIEIESTVGSYTKFTFNLKRSA